MANKKERDRSTFQNRYEKVLVVGIDSQIGKALKLYLSKYGVNVSGTSRKKSDATDTYYFDLETPNFDIFSEKFSVVVVCAATTNIAMCEKEPEMHRTINVTNTIKLIEKLAKNDTFIIFLSSNAVFNGEKAFYKYNEPTSPVNLYGKFKVEVEDYLTSNLKEKSCILRLTKVITNKNSFIERWEDEAKSGKNIITFANRYLSPVTIENVVSTIHILIKRKSSGLFQYGANEEISYTDYAKRHFKNNQLALERITPIFEKSIRKITHNSLLTHLPTSC